MTFALTEIAALCVVPGIIYPIFVSQVHRWKFNKREIKEKELVKWRWRHNFGLALYSTGVVIYLLLLVVKHGTGSIVDACISSNQSRTALWLWYFSKLWEWIDTFFLIATDKLVTRLHYRHHQTTCAACALTTNLIRDLGPTPVVDTATLLNAFAHTLMYAYYAYPSTLRFARRWITRIQIFQHVTVVTMVLLAFKRGCTGGNFYGYVLVIFLYIFYLVEFTFFYIQDKKKICFF
mmetsp:Transcript_6869/g.10201  ORF Transcript_6869/g.10201 Transcript_6869/m.10201 type:complete len:235 (-) Transcript_6869:661-1365(-)